MRDTRLALTEHDAIDDDVVAHLLQRSALEEHGDAPRAERTEVRDVDLVPARVGPHVNLALGDGRFVRAVALEDHEIGSAEPIDPGSDHRRELVPNRRPGLRLPETPVVHLGAEGAAEYPAGQDV